MAEIELKELGIGDAGWLIWQHAELYARDEGFDMTFEALVAEILADHIRNRDPTCERAFIAWRDGERLGSVFCSRHDAQTARLRMFLVLPEARGLGLGKHLLAACMEYARSRGYSRMILYTHKSHEAACALYARSGWICTKSYPVDNFGVALEEMWWEVEL